MNGPRRFKTSNDMFIVLHEANVTSLVLKNIIREALIKIIIIVIIIKKSSVLLSIVYFKMVVPQSIKHHIVC